ncbi:MAG: hypothetical protein WAP36_07040, partial [Halanaerobiales bacterium]
HIDRAGSSPAFGTIHFKGYQEMPSIVGLTAFFIFAISSNINKNHPISEKMATIWRQIQDRGFAVL